MDKEVIYKNLQRYAKIVNRIDYESERGDRQTEKAIAGCRNFFISLYNFIGNKNKNS